MKDFLGVVVLLELKKGVPKSGYDLVSMINRRYSMFLSSGTVYSLLYSLERGGLIEGRSTSRKRVYVLTSQGRGITDEILDMKREVLDMLQQLFVVT